MRDTFEFAENFVRGTFPVRYLWYPVNLHQIQWKDSWKVIEVYFFFLPLQPQIAALCVPSAAVCGKLLRCPPEAATGIPSSQLHPRSVVHRKRRVLNCDITNTWAHHWPPQQEDVAEDQRSQLRICVVHSFATSSLLPRTLEICAQSSACEVLLRSLFPPEIRSHRSYRPHPPPVLALGVLWQPVVGVVVLSPPISWHLSLLPVKWVEVVPQSLQCLAPT